MMRPQRLPALLSFLAAVLIGSPGWTADPKRALSLIIETGRSICYDIPLEGSSEEITATGTSSDTGQADRDFKVEKSESKGLQPDDVLEAATSSVRCRLTVLEKLLPKLLPPPDQTKTSTSDNAKIVPTAIQYEILEDPGSFVTDVMNAICYSRLGMVKFTSEGKCTRDACSVHYKQETAFSDTSIYITPQFTVVLSDRIASPATLPHSSAKREWSTSLPPGRVMVDSDFVMTRELPRGNASLLSDCMEKVGELVLGRFRLYDLGSAVAKLPNDKQADYSVTQSTLGDLDLSMLQVWLPQSINSGSAFVLETRLIPSSSLTAEIPNIDLRTVDEEARVGFEKLMSPVIDAVSRDRASFTIEFKSSSYRMLKLEAKKNEIETAAVKIIGEDLSATALTPEHQSMKPFKASIWSWMIKPTGSGERSAYLSIEVKRADGKVASSVVPLQLLVRENILQTIARFVSANWQWIAGTVVIPGLVFLWSKLGGKKEVPPGKPQQSSSETRQQRDRRDSRSRR
jgi:hypothetical protein